MKTWKQSFAAVLTALGVTGTAWASWPLELEYTHMDLRTVKTEGTLVFSDCPEYVLLHGVLAEGTVKSGEGRIYYYHVNESGSPARLVVYGESEKDTSVIIHRVLRGDPSRTYFPTGDTLSFREVTEVRKGKGTIVSLPAGKRVILAEDNSRGISHGDLVSGIVEVEVEAPTRFGVAFLHKISDIDVDTQLQRALPLPADSHEMRGTFPMKLYMENEVWEREEGPKEINVGDGVRDVFWKGLDELDKVERENTGHYGMTYTLTLHSAGKGEYEVYVNPQGGAFPATFFCRQRGKAPLVKRMKHTRHHWFGEGTIEDVAPLGRWKFGTDLEISFIPPGASSLPLRLLLIPADIREEEEPIYIDEEEL